MVPCKCGRVLRAKHEQLGSEIVCWDCRAPLIVAIPRAQVRFLRVICRAALDPFRPLQLGRSALAAGTLTLALAVPYAGLGLAIVLLVLGAVLYGEMIATPIDDEHRVGSDGPGRFPWTSPARWACAVGFALGTVIPLWVIGASTHHSPQLNRVSILVLAVTWISLPFVMAGMVVAEPPVEGATPTRRLGFVRSHPLVSLLVVVSAPTVLILSEVLVANLIHLFGALSLFVFDLMPIPEGGLVLNGYLYFGYVSYHEFPPERFNLLYLTGLRDGYSFIGAIPPSLSLPTNAGVTPEPINLNYGEYFTIRLFLVFLMGLMATLTLAVQARCLSVLTHAQQLRHA